MRKNKIRKLFGDLPPKYNFSLNPDPELRFSKCPDCQNKTVNRKPDYFGRKITSDRKIGCG